MRNLVSGPNGLTGSLVRNVNLDKIIRRKELPGLLLEMREFYGLYQDHMAYIFDVTRKTYNNWERGKTTPLRYYRLCISRFVVIYRRDDQYLDEARAKDGDFAMLGMTEEK